MRSSVRVRMRSGCSGLGKNTIPFLRLSIAEVTKNSHRNDIRLLRSLYCAQQRNRCYAREDRKKEICMKRVADRGSAVDRKRGGMTPRSMEHITRTAVQINCAVLICFSGLAMAQAGRLDATFGIGGTFVTHDTQSF